MNDENYYNDTSSAGGRGGDDDTSGTDDSSDNINARMHTKPDQDGTFLQQMTSSFRKILDQIPEMKNKILRFPKLNFRFLPKMKTVTVVLGALILISGAGYAVMRWKGVLKNFNSTKLLGVLKSLKPASVDGAADVEADPFVYPSPAAAVQAEPPPAAAVQAPTPKQVIAQPRSKKAISKMQKRNKLSKAKNKSSASRKVKKANRKRF